MIAKRRKHWDAEHEKVAKATRAEQQKVAKGDVIDPVTVFATLGEVMPQRHDLRR